MKLILSTFIAFFILLSTSYAASDEVYLKDLTPVEQKTGWGTVEANKSILGGPLLINGKKYENGTGLHAPAKLVYKIPENAKYFSVIAGLNDTAGAEGKVEIRIYAGIGNSFRLVAKSPILHVAENNKIYKFNNLEIRKSPSDQLLKIVVDNLEALSNDHVDICDGVFYTTPTQGGETTEQEKSTPVPPKAETTPPPPPKQTVEKQPPPQQQVVPQVLQTESGLKTIIKENLSVYFNTGKIIAVAITKKAPEIMNLPVYDPSFAIKEAEAAYVMIQFLPDRGRTIGQCDYVLIGETGDKYPCIALRSNNKTFNAGNWVMKTTLDTSYTMLFKINYLNCESLKFALHFNLPTAKIKDIPIIFNKK